MKHSEDGGGTAVHRRGPSPVRRGTAAYVPAVYVTQFVSRRFAPRDMRPAACVSTDCVPRFLLLIIPERKKSDYPEKWGNRGFSHSSEGEEVFGEEALFFAGERSGFIPCARSSASTSSMEVKPLWKAESSTASRGSRT